MLRIILFIVASSILNITASCKLNSICAQTVSGSWYGKADVVLAGNNSNYLTELILKQKGNDVEGIFAYYFKDSYQSFFIRGTYNPNSREVKIKNLPMLFYGADTKNGIECPMNFEGILMVSKVKSTMRGSFYTEPKYKYTCPELRVNMEMDYSEKNQDSILKNMASGKKLWKPQDEDFVVNVSANRNTSTGIYDTSGKGIVNNKTVAASDKSAEANAPRPDTISKELISQSNPSSPATTTKNNVAIPIPEETSEKLVKTFESRKNIYDKDIIVASDSILVQFYDNGDIDGDSISVFINKKPVLVNQLLSSRALNVFVALDTLSEISELSMFAVNLGKYPPNTALMVISDGIYKKEIYLSSSLTQNASIRLRRLKRNK